MKILYIHQYFKFPNESGGTRSYWIAKGLIKNKHEVVIITTKNNLKKRVERTTIDGINIIYLNIPYNNNMGILTRLNAFFNFMVRSTYYTLKERKVDLVFATSTPLTVGFPALISKWFKRVPYVFEVRDLWPEVPIQMGAIKNKLIIKAATFFEKIIYKKSSHVIALSPGMEKGVQRFIRDKSKVSMYPNMSKIDEFYPREISIERSKTLGIDLKKFNCIHFGAMGLANNLQYVLDAAKFAKDNKNFDINFIFLGNGSKETELKTFTKNNNLNNIKFLGSKTLLEVSEIVNACDVSIVSFANLEILKTNSPNKLFDSLSAGKPIIVNSSGWTKEMVEQNKCGFYSDPKDSSKLLEQIFKLKNNKQLYIEYAKNARILAETKYDKSIIVPKIVKLLENINKQNV